MEKRQPAGVPTPKMGRNGIPVSKPKDMKKTIKRLWGYISEDRIKLGIVIVCVIIATAFNLAASYMVRPIVNMLGSEGASLGKLKSYLLVMLIVYVIARFTQFLQFRLMVGISQKASQKLRDDLFAKVEELPLRFFDNNNHGDIMSRFTNDVDVVSDMLGNTVVQLISGVITLVGTFSLMVYVNAPLAFITVIMLPVFVLGVKAVTKKSRVYYKKQQAALGALNGYVEESISGQRVIKVFNHEEQAIEDFEKLNDDYRHKMVNAQFYGGIMGPVMGHLGLTNYTLTACIGGLLCIFFGFDIGGYTVFLNYSRQFSRPINEIGMQVNTIFSAMAGAERVFTVMDEEPEPKDVENAISDVPLKGYVRLENVDFGYIPEKLVLKNISLYAKPGQKIAFVGSTGAGKTTITNLLNRFYDINSGKIYIDDVEIKNYKMDFLRSNIAMVLQDTHLFTGSIYDNIRYGRLEATDEEVIEAAKAANADSFIRRLEHGYDTIIDGDGANLSQGQRQLLNIARAAISKAPILVLDEATSSVDTRTERHIEEALDRLMSDKTTFVIAHRLSTVRNANAIMVLEKGEIIERGDHDDLIAQKGRYYELYQGIVDLD